MVTGLAIHTHMVKGVLFHSHHPFMKVPQFSSMCASVDLKLHFVFQWLSYIILNIIKVIIVPIEILKRETIIMMSIFLASAMAVAKVLSQ